MGLDHEEFTKAFLVALSDEATVNKMKDILCGNLQFQTDKLNEANSNFCKQLNSFREINTQLQKEVTELRDIEKELENKLVMCESKLDNQEQYSRRNSLTITGIPESDNEDIVPKVLDVINNKIKPDIPVSSDHIVRLHRVAKRSGDTPRSVLIKFATYRYRQRVYRNRKNLKPTGMSDEPETPKYVNEDLTKKRANLLWKARCLKRAKMLVDCWTSDGTVLVKNNANKIIAVGSIAELDSI